MFALLTALLYGLVFLTPGSNSPKLGIDLQGGTRITLTAQTPDGSTPSRDSMNQARTIMENRVNGSGVVGADVQIDGSNQLVITVPGTQDLGNLTRSARLNIRPVTATGYDVSALPTSSAATSGASGSSGASSQAPVTRSAIGDTGGPTSSSQAPSASVGNAPATTTATGSAAATTGTTGSAQGLRQAAPATTAPAATPTAAPTTAAAPTTGATSVPNPAVTGTPAATPTASGTGATGTTGSGAASSGAGAGTFPLPGSDPNNANQPAAKDAAGWAAWVTAATTAVQNGSVTCKELEPKVGQDDPSRPLLSCGTGSVQDSATVYLLDATLIPGTQIDNAAAALDQNGAGWVINVSFDSAGYKTWSNYTANNVNKQTAFTLDGQVLSAPAIRQAITTTVTQVSGNFTQASATSLANSLKYGALPLNFGSGTAQSVSAELGSEYLTAGLIAGGIGLLLVVVYCLIYYRLLGVITILSLVLSGLLVYAIMVLLGRWIGLSLDMAGVAGLIIAIGITADSFVIYFERLKDEVREGRSFRSAVPRGWERAKRTILSADAVSFLSALVLYLVAVGDVKGFAFTLGLSTVLDLIVVFLVTHPLVALASGSRVFASPRWSGLGATAAAGARQRAGTARLTVKEA
ncbi:protein translocase subunit SecD [Nakamurella endophytica]|uniref:Protein translocase subunit SecD n=1 Tax=Nakamurella endophytica TaxID=1748367 RepID=A0A917TB23_9ACTN|nr:protein translocase subunit SecD [Nakamurella endophytica]